MHKYVSILLKFYKKSLKAFYVGVSVLKIKKASNLSKSRPNISIQRKLEKQWAVLTMQTSSPLSGIGNQIWDPI